MGNCQSLKSETINTVDIKVIGGVQVISIYDYGAFGVMLEAIQRDAIVIQVPGGVFEVLATPNRPGVEQINRIKKSRGISGKYYSTYIGTSKRYLDLLLPHTLPENLNTEEGLNSFEGSILRVNMVPPDFNSSVICQGTHQSFLFGGIYRQFFKAAECVFDRLGLYDTELFGGRKVVFPIGSSANVSGDPKGSITDYPRAIDFCQERGVKLLVTCPDPAPASPMPIFAFHESGKDARNEPSQAPIIKKLPPNLKRLSTRLLAEGYISSQVISDSMIDQVEEREQALC